MVPCIPESGAPWAVQKNLKVPTVGNVVSNVKGAECTPGGDGLLDTGMVLGATGETLCPLAPAAQVKVTTPPAFN